MKIKINGLEFDVDISTITYRGTPVMEIISDACDLAHQALIDLSTYRQEHNCGNQEDWELGDLELDCCEFLDKLGD